MNEKNERVNVCIAIGQYNLRQVQRVSIAKYNFAHDTLDKETRLTKW